MIWWFFLFILGFVFLHRKWRYRYLMAIPGPPSLPLIGNTLPMLASPERAWCLLQEYNKVYYPIYRLSNGLLDSVHISAPDDIELILSSKTHLRKSIIYDLLQSWLGKGLLTSDGDRWYHRRKLLTPTFHFNIIQQFFTVFATHSEALVQQLDKECDKSCTNIIPLITKFTLFTICETAMGTKLDEKKEGNRDYVSATFEMGQLFINRIRRPWLAYNVIFNMTEKKKEQTSLLNILHSFSKSVIEDRKQHFKEVVQNEDEHDDQFHQKKRVAMLDLLLSVRNSGAQISDEEIREEVDTFIFEGHDTTSAAISYALMLIANHSNVQEKIVEEINHIVDGSSRPLNFADIQQLSYLERVVKESLRMYPSVPVIGRRVDFDVVTSTSHVIPKDTIVSVHIFGLHHNPKFYPDPEKFDPDRFLPQNMKGRHPFSYIPFSAGPRNCIGQRFAMVEMKTAIASVVRNFRLLPIDKPSDLQFMAHLILKANKGVHIKFEKRQ
ncbi:hypothetical protein PPYR_09382 [Photinus pyralis]|uniref:Cytochrome P450 n=2 Tax=Photinus pyralis TaxID=7054 RepID=A0A1Y1M0Y8_PHOPY|nr:cytochrome P450 4C1-like isoform X1 [Photinus pyralis]KAB0798389.1 hypothetical protein PPYR_09382 [Photinus pyralis]